MGPPPLWRGGCILNVEGHAEVQGRRNKKIIGKPILILFFLDEQFKRQNLVTKKAYLLGCEITVALTPGGLKG